MENLKTNEGELTSTMGNHLSTSKDDKNEASDSTPTSSTDAFTTTSTSQIAADDPISSTSSDVLESKKSTEKVNDVAHSSTIVISSGSVMSMLKDVTMRDHSSPIVSEKDLLDMNITDTSTEKITENVDDIVQDLENLLGEPTESFDFTIRSRSISREPESRGISADIDAYSAELQMLGGQTTAPKDVPKTTPIESSPEIQENVADDDNKHVTEEDNIQGVSTNTVETVATDNATVREDTESCLSENQNREVPTETEEIKTETIEKFSSEHIENCQFEIISASSANTEIVSVEKSELPETQDVTSTDMKDVNCVGVQEESNSETMVETLTSAIDEQKLDIADKTEPQKMEVEEETTTTEQCEIKDESIEGVPETASFATESIAEDLVQPTIESLSEEREVKQDLMKEVNEPRELEMESAVESTKVAEPESTEQTNSSGNLEEATEPQESQLEQSDDIVMNTPEVEVDTSENVVATSNQNVKKAEEEVQSINAEETKNSVETSEICENRPEEITAIIVESVLSDNIKEAHVEVADAAFVEKDKQEKAEDVSLSETTFKEDEIMPEVAHAEVVEKYRQEKPEDVSPAETALKEGEIKPEVADAEVVEKDIEEKAEDASLAETTFKEDEIKPEVADSEVVENDKQEKAEDVSLAETTFKEDEIKPEVADAEVVKKDEQERAEDVSLAETRSKEDAIQSEITTELSPVIPEFVDQEVNPVIVKETTAEKSIEDSLTSKFVAETLTTEGQEDTEVKESVQETDAVKQALEESEPKQKQLCEEIQEKNESFSCGERGVIEDPKEERTEIQNQVEIMEMAGSATFDVPEHQTSEPEPSKTPDNVETIVETKISEELPIAVPVEEKEFEENAEGEALIEDAKIVHTDVEDTSADAPVDFIQESLEMPSHSLAEDLDLLVQNAVSDEPMAEVLSPVETSVNFEEKLEIPTSSVDNLEEGVIDNKLLPLAMDDVSDLDVLNAISTLNDNKSNLISQIEQDVQENDALLSNTLEQSSATDVPFESNIETELPTMDEIFAETNQQPQEELQDDNLETLLAVASLQSDDYNVPPVDDFTPPVQVPCFIPEELAPPQVQELPLFVPVEESKIDETVEALLEAKDLSGMKSAEETIGEVEVSNKSEMGEVSLDGNNEEVKHEVEEVLQQQHDNKLNEPLVINVDVTDKDRVYSPKITIKPIKPPEEEVEAIASGSGESESKGSLKMTITKQSDNTHSILKIYNPDDDHAHNQEDQSQHEPSVPKLIIKPIVQPNEQPQSPKMSTRSSKVFSPSSNQRSASPRITIKPIPKPEESVAPLKITIKPVLKPDDSHKQKHSPKLTIKPIIKPEEEISVETKVHSPRVTIKPIVKPPEEIEQVSSPRITIKPIVKPVETVPESAPITPRVTIKPVVKHPEKEKNVEIAEQVEKCSPKITIKPIVKPQEPEPPPCEDYEESIKERIVLKINKGTIPGSSKELRKRDLPLEEEKSEKLAKIKLKFSKEGGHPQIVQDQSPTKRTAEQQDHDKNKRQRIDTEQFLPGVTITPIGPGTHSKLKEMLSRNFTGNKMVTIDDDDDDVTIVEEPCKSSPIVISEESNQDSMNAALDVRDPISEIPVFEITPDSVKTLNPQPAPPVAEVPVLPAPRKRGRPRKVPLQVREDFKDPKEEEPKPVVVESTRPKRSCRGQSVRTTLGIKPRKPRGPGRGRGSKRGMGTRSTPTPPATSPRAAKEPKLSGAKLKDLKEDSFLLSDKSEVKTIEIDDGLQKSPSNSLLAPPQSDTSTTDRADIVMYEEETRMSAETSSRAQTPAKQVVTTISTVDLVEESQSSVQSIQSTATTESVKVRRGPRLEVHQEPEGAVISADQLAEYYWMGGGPYMLQEQVAQFLGIKSFKRKYPNIPRRVVDMQERDFIRESGLAGEAMCDLGLTAVNSSDILDIMYSDFQDKYEEYCKHQRDRQAKDLINKQKALSLAASQEKAKIDITQQAVQSAASWNATFNKARRDQRKSCMDLQTLTIHFPKGKMKQINKPKIGCYPVALVPGQFTDYYREFTPTEINNLPLNTMCYDRVIRGGHQEMDCDSQTDGSGSESDSSTSDSDSSYSGSSDGEDCTLCKPTPKRVAAAQ